MFRSVTLEMSAKPFKRTDDAYIRAVCDKVFDQWRPLVKDAQEISVLLWVSDGTELLDYKGDPDEAFEWAYLIGCANKPSWVRNIDPNGVSIQGNPRKYIPDPPVMTYGTLRRIVAMIRACGQAHFPDKKIRVGETFDPGPEFAYSDFKYRRHREICLGNDMGEASMICSYATFRGDDVPYAAFPDGIPDGLPFGKFLGKQAEVFLRDMGFDYIWFSNGLGFGRDAWATTGAIFDGDRFLPENLKEVQRLALDFWRDFREGCPDFPVETRGTNMSMGIDLSTDGIPLKSIYDGHFGMLPPANSPWAALNGDYGLELMGHMSRIAELPDDRYLFRFYLHDPWYVNSPWYDRYNSQPHDIYLPLAISRVDADGKTCPPTNFNILTIDNSYGNMPDSCVYEPLPHMIKAAKTMPDAPAPVVWVYPFDEYSAASDERTMAEMFFGDWYIRNAINAGIPLSSVTSTASFVGQTKTIYQNSVLVSPIPQAGSAYEAAILAYVRDGGRVIFLGDPSHASDAFLGLIGVALTDGVAGELPLTVNGKPVGIIKHDPLLSGGAITTVATGDKGFAFAGDRAVGTRGDGFVWLRGTDSCDYRKGGRRLSPHSESRYYRAERLMLTALAHFGIEIGYDYDPNDPAPVLMIHRHDGAYVFPAYCADPTADTRLRLPLGAPILDGYTVRIENGQAVYRFPKAERRECRVFVTDADGKIGCREHPPVSAEYRRRFVITGLHDSTVRILPEQYCLDSVQVLLNSDNDFRLQGEDFDGELTTVGGETVYEVRHATGELTVSFPIKEKKL